MVLLAPKMLGITALEAAVMGAVIAAVSPAVIVPKMLRLMEEGYGTAKSIPQMIVSRVHRWTMSLSLCYLPLSQAFPKEIRLP